MRGLGEEEGEDMQTLYRPEAGASWVVELRVCHSCHSLLEAVSNQNRPPGPSAWRKPGQCSTLPRNVGTGRIQTRRISPVVLLCPGQAQILGGLVRRCVIEDNLLNIPASAGRWCLTVLTLPETELHF